MRKYLVVHPELVRASRRLARPDHDPKALGLRPEPFTPLLGRHRLDLELLDPANEDERISLIEALHPELEDALLSDEETVAGGEPFNPRLHITLNQVVATQLLVGNPPETWQTVQRLAAIGYFWHNTMHMIARLVSDDIYQAMAEHRPFDPADYARRLNELPGD